MRRQHVIKCTGSATPQVRASIEIDGEQVCSLGGISAGARGKENDGGLLVTMVDRWTGLPETTAWYCTGSDMLESHRLGTILKTLDEQYAVCIVSNGDWCRHASSYLLCQLDRIGGSGIEQISAETCLPLALLGASGLHPGQGIQALGEDVNGPSTEKATICALFFEQEERESMMIDGAIQESLFMQTRIVPLSGSTTM